MVKKKLELIDYWRYALSKLPARGKTGSKRNYDRIRLWNSKRWHNRRFREFMEIWEKENK